MNYNINIYTAFNIKASLVYLRKHRKKVLRIKVLILFNHKKKVGEKGSGLSIEYLWGYTHCSVF